MPKLHEVIAGAAASQQQAEKCRKDLITVTFDKKRHHFTEKIVKFVPADEGASEVTEEQSFLQTTVTEELAWLKRMLAPAIDGGYQVDLGNLTAKADIVLDDGTTLAKDLPATTLLWLEKRANELHEAVSAIPTLDPTKGFTLDPDRPNRVYKSREESKYRTRKEQVPLVLIQPTVEHPGQAQLITKDVVTGTIRTVEWSGFLTPIEKGLMIERAESLRRAIKKALMRANDVSVTESKIGAGLLDYVFGTGASERA